jgi:hypothetical protein
MIIHVDFSKQSHNSELNDFLSGLSHMGLDDDDIFDIREAIDDPEAFCNADNVIQSFAIAWIDQVMQ